MLIMKKMYQMQKSFLFYVALKKQKLSSTGTRTRVFWVKAKYPNQLDYRGRTKIKRFIFNNQVLQVQKLGFIDTERFVQYVSATCSAMISRAMTKNTEIKYFQKNAKQCT
jgi:hypothetical protein